jgi:lysophospholipase L1-like esterase
MTLVLAAMAMLSAQPCANGLCDADRLRPFLDALAHARDGGRPVRIVQIGDSHTAGDQVTGSWRTILQSRYGSGGRGVLPPGRPYAGYLTRGITASQSAGWSVNGLFGASYAGPGAPPIGLSGFSLSTAQAGASMSLSADEDEAFDRFTVCAMRRPGAGGVAMSAGATTRQWSLDGADVEPACETIETGAPVTTASSTATGGAVTITSWATEREGRGGVTLSNLGTVGAQLVHFGRSDDALVSREFDEYRPDLIVVAFGTNEAFKPGFSADAYEAALRAQIARIRRLAGGAVPILMLGAPDSATRDASLQGGEPPCPGLDGSWRPTAALAVVQSIQRRRAHEDGAAYWDWSAAMGGHCAATRWSQGSMPMMRADRVHFAKAGGAEIARALQASLDAAMTPADR